MKKISLSLISLALLFVVSGCTYHGKIHRSIYHHKDFEEKINARVMVVSDKFYKEPLLLDIYGRYTYRLYDGLPVAVADALSTLFTEVDVNEYRYRKDYDYIAEIEYTAHISGGESKFQHEQLLLTYTTKLPFLITNLTITIRNPKTGYAVARYQDQQQTFLPTIYNDIGMFMSRVAAVGSFGILYPIEIQVLGAKVRKGMERGINWLLYYKIMPDMEEDRLNFTPEHNTELTNTRIDAQYVPFLQSTVYIDADNGLGSGFFISPDGYIITNAHVVGKARDVGVITYDRRFVMDKTQPVAFANPKTIRNKMLMGRVLKVNYKRDLALIKVEGDHFPWMKLETDRQQYATGKKVVAIGAPEGIEWTVSQGIISAMRDNDGVDTIQTDTAINSGNSGGPLIDLATGHVVGVNSWGRIADDDEYSIRVGVQALNFAISAFEVARTLGIKQQPINPDDFLHPDDDDWQTLPQSRKNYVK